MSVLHLKTPAGKQFSIDEADEMHRGGEGRIISVKSDSTIVAKIYHDNITPLTEDQFNYLSELDQKLFVSPRELLLDSSGKIAGFTMEYLGQNFFPLSSIFAKNFCGRNNVNSKVKKKIGESLIKAVEYAHKHEVVIGDLNQFNVMINLNGNLRLIDVDSYQTPNHPHSGILLQDIRDYLYGGLVTEESDFFALSVLVFNMLTHIHPFKGVHKIHKKIDDRMKLKLPIFKNDPDIKIPKAYEPLADKALQSQYDELYLQGDRFLLSLGQAAAISTKKQKPVRPQQFADKDVYVRCVSDALDVTDVFFTENLGYIATEDNYIIYDSSNKGGLRQKFAVSRKEYEYLFVTDKHVFAKKGARLYYIKSDTEAVRIKNFEFGEEPLFHQYENILMVLREDGIVKVYLDKIFESTHDRVEVEIQPAFTKGIIYRNAYIQQVDGNNRIFYNSGKAINNVKFDLNVKLVFQKGNVGIAQYIDGSELKYKYFKIDGMNVVFDSNEAKRFYEFGSKQAGMIFQPNDGGIKVIRTSDFQEIASISCSFTTDSTSLYLTNAGIIAWEDDVYILNKK